MISEIFTILSWIAVVCAGVLVLVFVYFFIERIADDLGVDFIPFFIIIFILISGALGAIYLLGGFEPITIP